MNTFSQPVTCLLPCHSNSPPLSVGVLFVSAQHAGPTKEEECQHCEYYIHMQCVMNLCDSLLLFKDFTIFFFSGNSILQIEIRFFVSNLKSKIVCCFYELDLFVML